MYQVGELVIYGSHGVCRVAEMEERVIDRKRQTYLALEPVGQDGSRYLVPTHSEAAMGKLHPVLNPQQLEEMLQSDEVHTDGWIPMENLRKQTYRTLIGSGDRVSLMKMVHTLYRRKHEQTITGRKFHQCDENFLRDAEKLLISEVAIVLGMEADQARKHIREQLK